MVRAARFNTLKVLSVLSLRPAYAGLLFSIFGYDINMKMRFFTLVVLVFLPLQSYAAHHNLSVATGNTNFNWEEFSKDDGRSINQEEGTLTSFSVLYSYREGDYQLKGSLTNSSGRIDYLGEKRNSDNKIKFPTTTNYDISEINLSYGKYINTDYIKPYAYIMGGYQDRERIINQSQDFSNRSAEKYTFYFWGVGMDAELFSWNNFSVGGGTYFKNYSNGEITLIDEQNHSSSLKQLKTIGLRLGFSYTFFDKYNAVLEYMRETSKMDISSTSSYSKVINTVETTYLYTHPKSDQSQDSILVTIGMFF